MWTSTPAGHSTGGFSVSVGEKGRKVTISSILRVIRREPVVCYVPL